MTAEETLNLISKQWCDLNDLMKLTGMGRNSCLKLKSDIKEELITRGFVLPKSVVPMVEVVKKLKFDIEYLRSMSS